MNKVFERVKKKAFRRFNLIKRDKFSSEKKIITKRMIKIIEIILFTILFFFIYFIYLIFIEVSMNHRLPKIKRKF